ncbi:glycosyltransferase [Flavobacterium sp. NRK F10]|uniref:glycosyltransferase family protein n=1 Tax=Flavobacterium sp. NRK F10 TaxID=2954931 RepID=UPI0020908EA6|nr:glycosyltransferase [Flavobacterium sp. NRK F10]MCO6173748.1 glycosyltransferase [Flavobacterium sp. NRK F10]
MRILLVGEYSRLHNSLKEGLQTLGHEVTIVGCGDKFKQFPVDHSVYASFTHTKPIIYVHKLLRKLQLINLEKLEKAIRFYFLLPQFSDYNHVQLINSDALETYPVLSRWLYKKLFQRIKNRSLLICGDETPVIDYLFKQELNYSILTPYFENLGLKKLFQFPLKYRKTSYRKTFQWLKNNCQSLITSDLDYEIPMQKTGFKTHFIPNPVNVDKIKFEPLHFEDKIIIFLGINHLSYQKKGIPFFEQALERIQKKYPNCVEAIVTENIPYAEYIQLYNKAHILLDQVYAYDQGYNALEAMAKGKVVFTGAETEFSEYYHLQDDRVCINAVPDVEELCQKLSFLIENPAEIIDISTNARKFIEAEHHYRIIAKKYLSVWAI